MNLCSYFSRGLHWPRTNWRSHKRVLNLKSRVLIQWRLIFSRINGAWKLLWEYHNNFCCIEISYLTGHSSRNAHINTVKSINLNFAVQFWYLYTWNISYSRHRRLQNGNSCVLSTQGDCNPIWMIRCQCTSRRQAILDQFLDHSKFWSLSCSPQRNPTDDRQRHCRYHPIRHHRQYPIQRKDEIFRLSLFRCFLLYLSISSVVPT